MTDSLDIATFKQLCASRQVWIWGAGNQGRGLCHALNKNSISVAGFIDRSEDIINKTALGLPIISPDIVKKEDCTNSNFIIIATFYFEDAVKQECKGYGLVENRDFIVYSCLKPNDYAIDISGACNLKCISCPHAYGNPAERKSGSMKLDVFKQVIDKILKESPFVGNLQLYQWGEPTLNKQLPEMLRYANEQGIKCAISSNLNVPADYRAIIEAKPEWMRLSTSGWGDNYEITHTRGKWDTFINNLREICALRNIIYPEMKVEVFFHIYKHSERCELQRWQAICADLAIELHPVYAYLISLDDVLAYQEGVALPIEAQKAAGMLFFPLQDGLAEARAEAQLACDTFRCININWDLSVSNCMMYYYPTDNIAATNYLQTSLQDIMTARTDCNLCQRCMHHGVHRYCGVYSRKPVDINSLR
jgi:hypothetical protein